ncbi:hypothetical protein COO60DRAFT_441818 [Scenedesmus sp. NREL 46B-D3]|nr:hypothetical protein COO60DRAFT_441818 [Scenedesmus sp. NREL 46B-D3]
MMMASWLLAPGAAPTPQQATINAACHHINTPPPVWHTAWEASWLTLVYTGTEKKQQLALVNRLEHWLLSTKMIELSNDVVKPSLTTGSHWGQHPVTCKPTINELFSFRLAGAAIHGCCVMLRSAALRSKQHGSDGICINTATDYLLPSTTGCLSDCSDLFKP